MRSTLTRAASLLGAVALAAVVASPVASAADTETCLHTGGSTVCQTTGDVQIFASPQSLPTVGSHPDPKWHAQGYNPKWDGFQQC